MASQLRLRVFLPVAILGVLGMGVGAFAFSGPASPTTDAGLIAANIAAKQAAKKAAKTTAAETTPAKPAKKKAAPKPDLTPLERALASHRTAVVLFYEPGAAYDTIQTREARAGALAANAGFIAVDASRNSQVSSLATKYEVRTAPTVLIFVRGPKPAARLQGFVDRATVAQAASNARR